MSESEVPAEPATTVRHLVEEAANNGNTDIVDEVFAESVEPLQEADQDEFSPEQLRSNLEDLREAMPDLHYEIDTLRHAGDRVYLEYTLSGTFENEMEVDETVLSPTGEHASVDGVIVTRFADGEIDGWGNFAPTLDYYQDLGIVPSLEEIAD